MVFVTGATGLVGAHLIADLVKQGVAVTAIYRKSIPTTTYTDKVIWKKADILDMSSLLEAMKGASQVYHCAAIVSFAPNDAHRMMKANQEGTANVVNACLELGVQKLVYVSSVAALGRIREDAPIDETMWWTPSTSNSEYGKSKYLAEMEVWRAMGEGLNVAIVNPVIILGAGDWHSGSSAMFKSAYNEFPWYTEGVSGFVDVLDVVSAMQLLMHSDISGERYILSAEDISYRSVFTMMASGFGKKPPHKKVTPLLAALVWRLEAIKGKITGKAPLLTKETAATAQAIVHFDNSKFLNAFSNFKYRKIEDTIQRTCQELLTLHHLLP